MCFSAGASFGASALLLGTGVVAVKKAGSASMWPLASVPLLFGVQQLTEGFLWLSFSNPEFDSWHYPSVYLFLLFAQVIWPIWIPFSVWLIEPDKARKKISSYFMLIGGAFSAYMLYCLFAYEVSAFIEARHIRYHLGFPHLSLRTSLYFLSAVVPLFLSSLRWMKSFAWASLGSSILSYLFFFHYIVSVWCFFAAVLSVLILFVVVSNQESAGRSSLTLKEQAPGL